MYLRVEMMFTTFISTYKMIIKFRPKISKGASRITTGPSGPMAAVADKGDILQA
jgi:hypothetical protein